MAKTHIALPEAPKNPQGKPTSLLEAKANPQNKGIPKIITLIWFGPLQVASDKGYWQNVIHWGVLNPSHQLNLITYSPSMNKEDFATLQSFGQVAKFNLIDLADSANKNFPLLNIIIFELGLQNYARAADAARVGALYQYGGVYGDTDLKPIKPLPAFDHAPLGFYQPINFRKDGNNKIITDVKIYFMATVKGHAIYAEYIKLFTELYQLCMSNPNYKKFLKTEDGELNEEVTGKTSGGIFADVLPFYFWDEQGKCLLKKEMNEFNIDIKPFIQIHCDRTWHKDHKFKDAVAREIFKTDFLPKCQELTHKCQVRLRITQGERRGILLVNPENNSCDRVDTLLAEEWKKKSANHNQFKFFNYQESRVVMTLNKSFCHAIKKIMP